MILHHLSLTHFRNYARLELDLPPGPILLFGDNAQGKTSLLEAIYYLATGHSPHTSSDRQLIHWLAGQDSLIPSARVTGEVASQEGEAERRKIDITLVVEPTARDSEIAAGRSEVRLLEGRFRKQIKINDVPRKRADLPGQLTVVLFLPQDVEVIAGSPSLRRRYMDDLLCQVDRDYSRSLATYDQVISQRNALLKQLADGSGGDPDESAYWDEQLIRAGTTITLTRWVALAELERLAGPVHRDLTGGNETLQLKYQPSLDLARTIAPEFQISLPIEISDFKPFDHASTGRPGPQGRFQISDSEASEAFAAQLQARHTEEIARGMTLVGPHRDELRFLADGVDLGTYGSRGQQRTAILALKLAEVEWMKIRAGDWPVLLLDEMLAELDAHRRAYLLARVNGANQAVMTSTDPEMFSQEFKARAKLLHVVAGRIEEI